MKHTQYHARIYWHKIKVPWKKGQPMMAFIAPPLFLFGWLFGDDPWPDLFGAN